MLRLSATPAQLCSDRRCAHSRPPLDVTNFEFNLSSFFIGGGNGSTPRKLPLYTLCIYTVCVCYHCYVQLMYVYVIPVMYS